MIGEGLGVQRTVAHELGAGIVRHVQPLVQIERQRIGALDAGDERTLVRRELRECAERAVDVKPHAFVARDVPPARRDRRPQPVLALPAVAMMTNGRFPARRSDAISWRSAAGSSRKRSSTFTGCSAPLPRPATSNARATEPCASVDV